ncbi:MAG: hypothetical protein M3280_05135, partial [Actinomycetota bacterium]|nr:hypothetical protein [Actinomycetota bacterium]
MKISRTAGRAAALIVGVVLGVSVVAAAGGLSSSDERDERAAPVKPSPRPSSVASRTPHLRPPEEARAVMLAWTPGSLPAGTEAALETLKGVTDATTVYAGLDWISSQRMGSRTVRPMPPGFSIPFEMAAVEPNEYARFVARKDRPALKSLRAGELLVARTEAELRGDGRGMVLDLGERRARVSGVVRDETTNGYEAIMAAPPPPEWPRADRFVLIKLKEPTKRASVERKLARFVPGKAVQTRMAGENPFLRYGDAVLPQLLVKATFGEFTARPSGSGTIEVEDRWERRNIRTVHLP